jgi:peptidoglycan/LPS O-acetylase OafA/YrhL
LVPLLAVWVYGIGEGGSATARLMATRPAVFLGEISYSIYMCHALIIGLLGRIVPEMNPPVTETFGSALSACLVAIVATATMLHRYFEKPARRFVVRLWAGLR